MELETIDERPERVVNFSRPRPPSGDYSSYYNVTKQPQPPPPRSVRAVKAFHEPQPPEDDDDEEEEEEVEDPSLAQPYPDYPDEPRFSIDSTRDEPAETPHQPEPTRENRAHSELLSQRKPPSLSIHDQRYSPHPPSRGSSSSHSSASLPRGSMSGSNGSGSFTTASDSSASNGKSSFRPKGILKRSNLSSATPWPAIDEPGEDTASHHTVSEDGSSDPTTSSSSTLTGSEAGGKWSSSDFDISALSEKKRKKLEKKGINPALYMEMKAARAGKGRAVGALTGNTYVN